MVFIEMSFRRKRSSTATGGTLAMLLVRVALKLSSINLTWLPVNSAVLLMTLLQLPPNILQLMEHPH